MCCASSLVLNTLPVISYVFLSQDNVEEGDEEEENNTKDEEVDTKNEAGK